MKQERTTLSAAGLAAYMRCPHRYRLEYTQQTRPTGVEPMTSELDAAIRLALTNLHVRPWKPDDQLIETALRSIRRLAPGVQATLAENLVTTLHHILPAYRKAASDLIETGSQCSVPIPIQLGDTRISNSVDLVCQTSDGVVAADWGHSLAAWSTTASVRASLTILGLQHQLPKDSNVVYSVITLQPQVDRQEIRLDALALKNSLADALRASRELAVDTTFLARPGEICQTCPYADACQFGKGEREMTCGPSGGA